MAKKKSKKTKGSTKAVKTITPWDNLDIDTLKETVASLSDQYSSALEERIHVQTEHDTVRSYYDITKQENHQIDIKLRILDHELKQLRQGNRAEYKVYDEKIKHLRYDFGRKMELVKESENASLEAQHDAYHQQLIHQEDMVMGLREELKERQLVFIEELKEEKKRLDGDLQVLTSTLDQEIDTFEKRCKLHEVQVEEDLKLKHHVEMRNLRERANFHVHELERRNNEMYQQTLSDHCNVEEENQGKIVKLSEECCRISNKISKNIERSQELKAESLCVSGPLVELTLKVNEIKARIRDKEKNQKSKLSVKARKIVVEQRIQEQVDVNEKLKIDFDAMEKERDHLENELQRLLANIEEDKKKDIADSTNNLAVENGKKVVWKSIEVAENQLLACQLQIDKKKEGACDTKKNAMPLSPLTVNSDIAPSSTLSKSKGMSGSKRQSLTSSSTNVVDVAISSLRSFDDALNTLRRSEIEQLLPVTTLR